MQHPNLQLKVLNAQKIPCFYRQIHFYSSFSLGVIYSLVLGVLSTGRGEGCKLALSAFEPYSSAKP